MFVTPPHLRCFWFEIVETVRRLALTSGIVCIEDETARQMAAFLFCLAAIELYEYFEPYKLESNQTLSLLAQWMLLFMFVTALAEKVHVWDGARCLLPAARCPLPAVVR